MTSSPFANLFDMDARRQQRAAERPAYSGGNELRFSRAGGELVFFHFVSSGQDDFILYYLAHGVPFVTQKGEKITVNRLCPRKTGIGEECKHCDEGNEDIKERMSMWLYVTNILHSNLPEGKSFPLTPYSGRTYYNEEVNDFRIWHTSAWRESPWEDIVRLATLHKGLHNFMGNLVVSGAGMQRRYKIYPLPEPAVLKAELYERAKAELTTVPTLLKQQLGDTPTQTAPQPQVAQQESFNPVGGATIANSFGSSPAPVPEETSEELPIEPEKDEKRPLKGMF